MRAKLFGSRKRKVTAMGAVLALVLAASALAYWTIGGSGSGTVATGDATAVTINQTTTVTGLYPGGPPVTLSGTFTNNGSPANVGAITALVADPTDGPGGPCQSDDFEVGGSAAGPYVVPNGTGVGSWTGLTIRMVNKTLVNQDGCKNATVTLNYTANAAA